MTGTTGGGPSGRYDEKDHERFSLVPAAYVLFCREIETPGRDAPGRDVPGSVPGTSVPGTGVPRPAVRGRAREVLLQLRRNTGYRDGYWATAAAGHVEEGESVLAAAVREAHEELGVGIAPDDLAPLTVLHRGVPGGPAVEQRADFFFRAVRWSGEPAIQEPEKAADLRWFPLDALPEPVVPHEAAVLGALRAEQESGVPVPSLMTSGFGEPT